MVNGLYLVGFIAGAAIVIADLLMSAEEHWSSLREQGETND